MQSMATAELRALDLLWVADSAATIPRLTDLVRRFSEPQLLAGQVRTGFLLSQ